MDFTSSVQDPGRLVFILIPIVLLVGWIAYALVFGRNRD